MVQMYRKMVCTTSPIYSGGMIKTQWTDADLANAVHQQLMDVGKQAVMVEKDVPGFSGNRLQQALCGAAISLVENGICTSEAVDDVVNSSYRRRLAVLWPIESADLVGIKPTQDIHKQVLFDLDNQSEPASYLQFLLDDSRSGMASGAGFRNWSPGDLENTKARISKHLNKLEDILPE